MFSSIKLTIAYSAFALIAIAVNIGGIIGLAIGCPAKYHLDKRNVFGTERA